MRHIEGGVKGGSLLCRSEGIFSDDIVSYKDSEGVTVGDFRGSGVRSYSIRSLYQQSRL
jgi:hypothetical protein